MFPLTRIKIGDDTFGRVKVVDGTRIVTAFLTLQGAPLHPRESFYVGSRESRSRPGETALFQSDGASVLAIPLRSIDRASVLMAYARGLFGVMTIAGVLLLFPAIHALMGEPLDDFGWIVTKALIATFVVGVVGGSLSYAVPLLSERERAIRRYCGERLGIAMDPARLRPEWAEEIIEALSVFSPTPEGPPRRRLIRDLILARARLALASGIEDLEALTDRRLEELDAVDRRDVR